MPATTPAPWSIPYPVGTDRVADGDNAMQAIADRLNVIQNAMPRGYLGGGGYQGAAAPISDNNFYQFPAMTFPSARDLLVCFSGSMQSVTAGTGIEFQLVEYLTVTTIYSKIAFVQPPGSFQSGFSAAMACTLNAGTYTFLLKGKGYGANNNTTALVRCDIFDSGATGAI